jgi:hypothetical protein
MADIRFDLALDKFRACEMELKVRIHGGIYKIPGTDDEVKYHGIDYTADVKQLLEDSTDKNKSYIALRNAERVITEVQEIRLSAMIVKVELKSIMDRPELPKNPQLSNYYKAFKDIMTTVSGYLDVCDKHYSYMTEILFGVSQVNISINRRFFGGENMMYNY